MTRRKKLTLAAGVALVLIAAAMLWPRAKGPTHEGKTVEEWFRSYHIASASGRVVTNSHLQKDYVEKAFVALGTNAVPYLVERMTQDVAVSKVAFWRIKLHDAVPSALKPLVPPPRDKHFESSLAAHLLSKYVHPPAEMLIPLIKPVLEGTNVTQQMTVLSSLAGTSGDRKLALSHIFKALESPSQYVQLLAALNISAFKGEGWAGLDVTPAVSNLTVMINSTFPPAALYALLGLGEFGTNASSAIPVLQEMLAKENSADRQKLITNALEKIQSPVAPERKPD